MFRNALAGADTSDAPVIFEGRGYRATLSSHGGLLTSWVLKGFTDARELPADLVRDPEQGMLRSALVLDGREIDLGSTSFVLSSESTADGRSASLEAQDSSGLSVRFEYLFGERSPFGARMRVRIDGVGHEARESFLQVSFAGGISHLERDPKVDRNASAGVAQIGSRVIKKRSGRGNGDWVHREPGEVIHWAGVRSKYFLLALLPQGAPDGEIIMSRVRGDENIATALRLPLSMEGATEYEFEVYAGPMQYSELKHYDAGLENVMDLGWKIIQPFTRLLQLFFEAVHRVVPNYGLVIIILSAVVKLVFYPLTHKSMHSMRQMQLLKPEMDKLNEKYKEDPKKRSEAMMALYRKHKVNPLGGCLPILVQMPVFIALYNVLNTSIELRKSPFALWIHDLSAPDRVGAIAGLPIHILPLVMAGTMVWQQKLTPTDPRQAAMAYMMPVIMTVFFYAMPSGLVLYWTVTNLMAIAQQMWMNRSVRTQPAAA